MKFTILVPHRKQRVPLVCRISGQNATSIWIQNAGFPAIQITWSDNGRTNSSGRSTRLCTWWICYYCPSLPCDSRIWLSYRQWTIRASGQLIRIVEPFSTYTICRRSRSIPDLISGRCHYTMVLWIKAQRYCGWKWWIILLVRGLKEELMKWFARPKPLLRP